MPMTFHMEIPETARQRECRHRQIVQLIRKGLVLLAMRDMRDQLGKEVAPDNVRGVE